MRRLHTKLVARPGQLLLKGMCGISARGRISRGSYTRLRSSRRRRSTQCALLSCIRLALEFTAQWLRPHPPLRSAGVFVQKARDIGVPGNLKELFDKFAQTGDHPCWLGGGTKVPDALALHHCTCAAPPSAPLQLAREVTSCS